MEERIRSSMLAKLYSQLGPLISRVNEIHTELNNSRNNLGTIMAPSDLLGVKRSRVFSTSGIPPYKKRRLSKGCELLQLPESIIWIILRQLDLCDLISFSETCSLARLFVNDKFIWFRFHYKYFGKLECKQVLFPYTTHILQSTSYRIKMKDNWIKGIHKDTIIPSIDIQKITIDNYHNSNIIYTLCKSDLVELDLLSGKSISTIKIDKESSDFLLDSNKITIAGTNTIRCFNYLDRQLLYDISLLSNPYRIKYNQKYLISALWNGSISLFEYETGKSIGSFNAHNNPIHSLDCKKNIITTGSSDRSIRLWNYNGKKLSQFDGHSKTVISLCLTNNSSFLFSGSRDGMINYWDINQEKCITNYSSHSNSVTCLAWKGDSILVSGSSDNNILLWDIRQRTPIHLLSGHTDEITSFDIDESKIISCSKDRRMILWDFLSL